MIRVAIVEDDAEVQGVLQEYVRRYTRQYGTEFEVTVFADGVDILDNYRAVYDIIFLDVEMKHLDGMTTAERIRQMDADVILIFITNICLLYTSDAADEEDSVDLCGCRIIKKQKTVRFCRCRYHKTI